MENLADYQLGETDSPLICIGAEENKKVTVALIQQAERTIDILSHDLEPAIYDNEVCYEAMLEFILRSRYTKVRILIHEPQKTSQRGHRLLELGMRLSSSVYMRKPALHYAHITETFLIADNIGVLHRAYTDSYKATAGFNDLVQANRLSRLFNTIWEESEHDANLRRLML